MILLTACRKYSDKYNWVPDGSGQGAAALWDIDYEEKEAYFATIDELQKVA